MKIRMFTLPNMLTLCNLLGGCAALLFCLGRGDLRTVFWLVVASAALDFLDGLTARLTGSYSEIGKQLDSLADMVSFGAVPAAVLFSLYVSSGGDDTGIYYGVLTASVALFSALRLARFNIDPGQADSFTGLPTPACALLVASCGWLFAGGGLHMHPVAVLVVSIVLSFLLVSPIKMFALKFRDWSWRGNAVRYLFILCSGVAVAIWHIAAIPAVIVAYILLSAILAVMCRGTAEGEMNKND